jgi:DNA-binding IclR family transcriptional regulator
VVDDDSQEKDQPTRPKGDLSSTLIKAIDILDLLVASSGPMSLSVIAKQVGFNITVTHRLVSTLRHRGLIIQDPATKGYSLGWRLVNYGDRVLATIPYAALANPWLEQLRDMTGETTTLHVRSGEQRICVLECESRADLRRSVGVGRRGLLHKGASGRAILAFLTESQQKQILAPLSDTERQTVSFLLDDTRARGYAISYEESARNVASVAAPVFDAKGNIVSSISISGPLFRWTVEEMVPFIPELLKAAAAIREEL